jgi:cell division protein ZapA (FtsZ GTPase activity inhibitor)
LATPTKEWKRLWTNEKPAYWPEQGGALMKTLEVEIFNHHFAVLEKGNASYLQTLAAEVDARIHALCAASEKISPLRAAIMAAYQFADEAKREQGKLGTNQDRSAHRLPRTPGSEEERSAA